MLFDLSELSETKKYKIMSNTIFPRPVAWIATEDAGVVNLAPFSYFAPLSSEPPLVIVSIAHKEDGTPKDTYRNLHAHGRCTINLAHKGLLQDLERTAQELDFGISESEHFGIAMRHTLEGYPPMVEGAHCALFCTLVRTVDLGARYEPMVLRIEQIYVNDEHVDAQGRITLEQIGRVGIEYLVDALRVRA
ncbi:MAG: flavin reductase family protein [Campylobacterales bacterium]|nr:flavin reductase family protein [Campylobacterales bacterium]